MNYVDGFVSAVPTADREKYLRYARQADTVFKEHGKRLIYGGFQMILSV